MRNAAREPLSPELILVAPPDEAERAREELAREELARAEPVRAEPVRAEPVREEPASDWEEFLSTVRARSVPPTAEREPAIMPRTTRRRRPILVGALVVVTAAAAGVLWASRDESPPPSPSPRVEERNDPGTAPPETAGFVPARVWSWTPAKGAARYRVRFFRDGRKVLDMRTPRPRLTMPQRFTFRPGAYRWTVVPLSRGGKAGRRIVESRFVVPAR